LNADVERRYLLAKTYFDLGEFQRCAYVLSPSDSFSPAASGGAGPSAGAGLCGLNGEELFLKGSVFVRHSLRIIFFMHD